MRRRAVLLVLAAGALVGACRGDDPRSPPATASSTTAPSTSEPPTITLAPTTTASPLVPVDTPVQAARALLAAWKAGDRDAALAIAAPAAVDALFAAEPGSVQDRGCNQPPADTPVLCVYRTGAGELQLRATPVPGGWIVDQAVLTES